jgi:hypothetical protein
MPMQTQPSIISYQPWTNPQQYWSERRQRVHVGTEPLQHSWSDLDQDIGRVLNNIAAASHACNIHKTKWICQCFATPGDSLRFLKFLRRYKGHINSYWFYALLGIVEVSEDQVSDAQLLAEQLYVQAVRTEQLQGIVY